MWPFRKRKFSLNLKSLPENWKELLRRCNFILARKELARFLELVNSKAEQEGKITCFRKEFVRVWEAFARCPNYETAVAMIEGAPDYAKVVWSYFIECCPGGRWAFYDSILGNHIDH
jgi:hypothetical protein